MKLLFLIDSLGSGGAQRQLSVVATLLKQSGDNVEVLCYHNDDFFAKKIQENNIPIHWVTPKNNLMRIWKVCRFIRKGNYDSVVSLLDTPDLLNCLAAIGGKNWKVITSERSAKEEFFHTKRGHIIGWFKQFSDKIVCNSENARQMWLKYYPLYDSKLDVIYNPVILPEIKTIYTPRVNGKTRILVAASYQYLKNPINVVKAIALLDDQDKAKLQLDWYGRKEVTVGNTTAYEETINLISEYKLQEIIKLHDATNKIAEKMKEADVVALFSRVEGLPNAICEGMMLSKPILMSRVSDYDIIIDKENGILCDWDNLESIKSAISLMINKTNEELLSMGKNSRSKANVFFHNEKITQQWKQIIS